MSLHTAHNGRYSVGNIIVLHETAYVLRFINNLKAKVSNKPLTTNNHVISSEIKRAKFMWIIDNQSGLTNDDYQNLKVNLNLQADVDGVARS